MSLQSAETETGKSGQRIKSKEEDGLRGPQA